MVSLRSISTLFLLAVSTAVAQANPTAAEVVTKAHSAALKEATSADKVKGLRIELKIVDADKKPLGSTILELVAPYSRRQIDYTPDFYIENVTASNGLEGWISRRELSPSGRTENKIIQFQQVARMKDSTASDLNFYAAPEQNQGSINLSGTAEIDGKKVYSIEYKYNSGHAITRHFDTKSYELVATDQVMPDGKLQRQLVKELFWVDGLSFTKREEIYLADKKVAEVTYEKVTINPSVSESAFAFPVR
jgi:outer membrane lipoprotein-sorting protein